MWTEARIEELKTLWVDHSASEIAEKFGVSRNSVIGKIHRLETRARIATRKPDRRHWSDEAISIMRELWRDNSTGVIAAALAERGYFYTHQAVCMKGLRIGLPHKGRGGVNRMSPTTITRRKVGSQRPKDARFARTEPESLNLSLLDLEPGQCRWANGDRPYLFCGHPVEEGHSYCPHHYARTVQPEWRTNAMQRRDERFVKSQGVSL